MPHCWTPRPKVSLLTISGARKADPKARGLSSGAGDAASLAACGPRARDGCVGAQAHALQVPLVAGLRKGVGFEVFHSPGEDREFEWGRLQDLVQECVEVKGVGASTVGPVSEPETLEADDLQFYKCPRGQPGSFIAAPAHRRRPARPS